jgi:hypothetical protein
VRDRRWDFLYERQKQPAKQLVLERFAEELARELSTWPPPFEEWVSEELRRRHAAGMAERPRQEVLRLALEVARLDLGREMEAIDRILDSEAPRRWRTGAEAAAGHLLSRLVTEKCLALKERAEGVKITRGDLIEAVRSAERRLFRVTLD